LNLSFYIAKRYILGKKSHSAINFVSAISMGGVIFGSIAFILILSVFNGFDQLAQSMYNAFNADLQIIPANGKVFEISGDTLELLKSLNGVDNVTEVLEDNALLIYNEKQMVCRIKGVGDNYEKVTKIDSLIWQGEFKLKDQSMPRAVVGRGISYVLGINIDLYKPLVVYVPKRTAGISNDPNKTLNRQAILVDGIFSSQPDIDGQYALVPLGFARKIFEYPNSLTSLEIKLNPDSRERLVMRSVKNLLGDNVIVKNRQMQNEALYKAMRNEKWVIFFLLALVLILLLFSLVGSVSMLIIEKKKDIGVLYSLGANSQLIRKIFLREGILITLSGLVVGLSIGSLICILQEQFKLVKLHGGFIIDAYPVDIQWFDLIIVVFTVFLIGSFSSWYAIKFLLKRNFKQFEQI
jgi:lipoprotein-releasing system permease protein